MIDEMRARIANKRACEKDSAEWRHEEIEALLDSVEKMDDLHSRTTEAILLALGDAGATEPTDEPETWRYVPIAERVKRVVEERDLARGQVQNMVTTNRNCCSGWEEAIDELATIREVLDNAPVPSTNTDRTPSTLTERVEWLVWAWRESEYQRAKGDGE